MITITARWQAMDRKSTCADARQCFGVVEDLGSGAHLPFGGGPVWLSTTTLFFGLGSDVHFTGEVSGMQWEDYLFELQSAVEWRVMALGSDERTLMHSMSYLLSTREGMSNRELIDSVAAWILQDNEQEQKERAGGVKALFSRATATTSSGRAKELVKQGLSDRSGMIAFGTVSERFGETAGVAKLIDVFQFQWQSGR